MDDYADPTDSVTIPNDGTLEVGFHSPPPTSLDPIPPLSDTDRNADDENEEKLREELQNQLNLEGGEGEWGDLKEKCEIFGWEECEIESGSEEKERGGDDVEKKDAGVGGNGGEIWQRYPVRPEAEDCAYYMKTASCKFGANCRFNHPVRRKNPVAKEKDKEWDEETTEKPAETECKYYLRTGGCKYGAACRYNHSRAKVPGLPAKTPTFPIVELNFLGLPIRPAEKECPYYMRNGSCKYGSNCIFNHPDPTAAARSDPPAFGNGGSTTPRNSSQSNITSWSSPRAVNEAAPYVPVMFSPNQGVPPHNPEWNGYQAPLYPPQRGIHPPPTYVLNNPPAKANIYAHQQIVVDGFPERPGQPECAYFMKTGDCKFKSNCKFHHPKNRISNMSPCALSDKGLPLRPDQNICSHYSRYGLCKFGPACKFNHPVEAVTSIAYRDDQPTPFSNSAVNEEARIPETENGSNNAIQQHV